MSHIRRGLAASAVVALLAVPATAGAKDMINGPKLTNRADWVKSPARARATGARLPYTGSVAPLEAVAGAGLLFAGITLRRRTVDGAVA